MFFKYFYGQLKNKELYAEFLFNVQEETEIQKIVPQAIIKNYNRLRSLKALEYFKNFEEYYNAYMNDLGVFCAYYIGVKQGKCIKNIIDIFTDLNNRNKHILKIIYQAIPNFADKIILMNLFIEHFGGVEESKIIDVVLNDNKLFSIEKQVMIRKILESKKMSEFFDCDSGFSYDPLSKTSNLYNRLDNIRHNNLACFSPLWEATPLQQSNLSKDNFYDAEINSEQFNPKLFNPEQINKIFLKACKSKSISKVLQLLESKNLKINYFDKKTKANAVYYACEYLTSEDGLALVKTLLYLGGSVINEEDNSNIITYLLQKNGKLSIQQIKAIYAVVNVYVKEFHRHNLMFSNLDEFQHQLLDDFALYDLDLIAGSILSSYETFNNSLIFYSNKIKNVFKKVLTWMLQLQRADLSYEDTSDNLMFKNLDCAGFASQRRQDISRCEAAPAQSILKKTCGENNDKAVEFFCREIEATLGKEIQNILSSMKMKFTQISYVYDSSVCTDKGFKYPQMYAKLVNIDKKETIKSFLLIGSGIQKINNSLVKIKRNHKYSKHKYFSSRLLLLMCLFPNAKFTVVDPSSLACEKISKKEFLPNNMQALINYIELISKVNDFNPGFIKKVLPSIKNRMKINFTDDFYGLYARKIEACCTNLLCFYNDFPTMKKYDVVIIENNNSCFKIDKETINSKLLILNKLTERYVFIPEEMLTKIKKLNEKSFFYNFKRSCEVYKQPMQKLKEKRCKSSLDSNVMHHFVDKYWQKIGSITTYNDIVTNNSVIMLVITMLVITMLVITMLVITMLVITVLAIIVLLIIKLKRII